jgi:hypothetical protein
MVERNRNRDWQSGRVAPPRELLSLPSRCLWIALESARWKEAKECPNLPRLKSSMR